MGRSVALRLDAALSLFSSNVIAGCRPHVLSRIAGTRVGAQIIIRLFCKNISNWNATEDVRYYSAAFRLFWSSGIRDEIIEVVTRPLTQLEPLRFGVVLGGWAGPNPSDAHIVRIVLDGVELVQRRSGRRRIDVEQHFGLTTRSRCGFELAAMIPVGSPPDAIRRLVVSARSASGSWLQLGTADAAVIPMLGSRIPECGAGYVDDIRVIRRISASLRSALVVCLVHTSVDQWLPFVLDQDLAGAAPKLVRWLRVWEVGEIDSELKYLFTAGEDLALNRALTARGSEATHPYGDSGVKRIVRAQRDQRSWLSAESVRGSYVQEVIGPTYFPPKTTHCSQKVTIPAEQVFRARNVTLLDSGVIVRGGDLLVVEPAADPVLGFVAGNSQVVIGAPQRLGSAVVIDNRRGTVSVDRGILVTTRVPSNYFHLLIENIARMVSVAGDPRYEDASLLVSARTLESGLEAIRWCMPTNDLIKIPDGFATEVGELISPSFHTRPFDNTLVPWYKSSGFSPRHIHFVRERLLPHASETVFSDRIYLTRGSVDARRLINSDQVETCMSELGFLMVDPGELTLSEQISLFAQAKVIVGTGGAASSNVIFASKGAKVITLISEQLASFHLWSNLAAIVGADSTYVTGRTPTSPLAVEYRRDYFHLPFSVDTRLLKRVVVKALRESGSA